MIDVGRREDDFERVFGIPLDETPETLGYELSSQFGTQVLNELKRRGMTLSDLAAKAGVRPPTVSGWLSPESNMTMRTVAKIAMALGCEVIPPQILEPGRILLSAESTEGLPHPSNWDQFNGKVIEFKPKFGTMAMEA